MPAAVRNEIAALKRRVTYLERELIRGVPERPVRTQTSFDSEVAEANARAKAEREYWQGKRDAQLLADPDAMRRARKAEREFNDFLRARGIKPLPSRLPRRPLVKRRAHR
ncbi:MAG: hypothetical protein Q7J25_05320 [Vicinamibacterales bacterium]|nr:hypothetical protein [Vicinamibacterales bacterium]